MNASTAYKTPLLGSLFNPLKIEQDQRALNQLATELDLVQTRLGTESERPDDCDLAQELGHKIRNKLLILSLWESLGFAEIPLEIRRRITPIGAAK